MKSLNTITVGAGLLVVVAALIGLRDEKILKNQETPTDNPGFAVVELFTSEGCSSCPPADELVEKIQTDNKEGQLYILAFHVDYWDHQGWKDRFSNPEFSKRQRQYAGWLDLGTIYTPQIVVNGTTEYVGSDESPILNAISDGLALGSTATLTLNCTIAGDHISVEYQETGNEKKSELVLSLVQKSAQSNVRAGENSGRNLSHVQIVRRMTRVPIDMNMKSITVNLPGDFDKKGWEIIGFVQQKSNGHITAAHRFDFDSVLTLSE